MAVSGDQQPDGRLLELGRVLARAFSLYGKDLTPEMIQTWSRVLADYSPREIAAAMGKHMRDPEAGMYPPMPAHIMRHLAGTPEELATAAWGKVMDAVQRYGSPRSVVFDDPAIHAAIAQLGGWIRLCGCSLTELPHFEREFRRIHRAASAPGAEVPNAPPVLSGWADTEENHPRALPVAYVGDHAKAIKTRLALGGSIPAARQLPPAASDGAQCIAAVAALLKPGEKPA